MSLVSLADMKTFLGVVGVDDDAFLTEQLNLLSETIESYCGRIFPRLSYTQTFYADEMQNPSRELFLYHYPLVTLNSVLEDGENITANIRPHKPTARLVSNNRDLFFRQFDTTLVVTYEAGYDTIPLTIQSVVKSLVEERYNKKKAGLDLNFGRDVQSISIPGTINVQFDYTLQANERKNAYGMLLGDYTNVLDQYRSERVLIGSIGINYVE